MGDFGGGNGNVPRYPVSKSGSILNVPVFKVQEVGGEMAKKNIDGGFPCCQVVAVLVSH